MSAIAFHFNVAERSSYLCRLVRKARRSGARLVITGERAQLDQLDRLLWTFDPLEFLPHWKGRSAAELPPRLADTPTLLLDQVQDVPQAQVLINLREQVPQGFESFGRVIEIVSRDGPDRDAARERWRTYAAAGHTIERHEVAG
jgi:DNA polymerase III subunit chi